jgi:hypothetical protein
MDDALLVRRFESGSDLAGIIDCRIDGQRTGEVLAIDQFHDDRSPLSAINLSDIGVVQRGEHLRLASESGHAVSIFNECSRQHLNRYVAIELGVSGALDGAHAALTQLGNDAIVRNRWMRTHLGDLRHVITFRPNHGQTRS